MRDARNHMKDVRKDSMFKESKYSTLNENLAKKIAENLYPYPERKNKEDKNKARRELAGKQILENIENKCRKIFDEDKYGDIGYLRAKERGRTANVKDVKEGKGEAYQLIIRGAMY